MTNFATFRSLPAGFPSGVHTVASVASANTLAQLAAFPVAQSCDVVEFRADAWPQEVELAKRAMQACPAPGLLTVRRPEEGGIEDLSLEARRNLMLALLPFAALIDIEIASLVELQGVVEEARQTQVLVVASAHDFQKTPCQSHLAELMIRAASAGADIVKFAVTPHDAADLQVLTGLLAMRDRPPLSVMGMGPLGRVSRLLCAQLGSCLNYGYLDEATVPGQWPAARLRDLIHELRS